MRSALAEQHLMLCGFDTKKFNIKPRSILFINKQYKYEFISFGLLQVLPRSE